MIANKPVGGCERFLILMNSLPFASKETREEAEKTKEMYSRNCLGSRGTSFNAKQAWSIEDRGSNFNSGWSNK